MVEVALKNNRGVSTMLNEHSKQKASRQKRRNKDKELRVKKKNNKRGSRRRNKKMISKTLKKRRHIRVDNNPDNPTTRLIADDVVVVLLSRLPVKLLLRFKCVCKRWKLIIEDPHFIHSHLTHSETRPGLFVLLPKSTSWEGGCARDYESFISADLHFSGRAANVHTIWKTKLSYRQILGPITGLVCFVDSCAVQIHNVSTMESTPWIKSKVRMNLEKDGCIVNILEEPTCYFGFDPTTKKHKAIFVWCRGKFRNFPVCEVLTVGNNTWRIIDEALPYSILGNITQYANGSIYWLIQRPWVMAFDIGSEKFRVIRAPKFTVENELGFQRFSEVDGCLAIVCQDEQIVNMWILHDHNKENGSSTSSSSEKDWTQLTITLPSNNREDWWFVYFYSVAGTDQIILETYRDPGPFGFRRNAKLAKFYFYDLKQKTFKKFEVDGISFFSEYSRTECVSTFVESLLPVQKKL
ncbi:putative F-box protein At1g50870 [Papaver somniferum]|uniref:putative F-box protein At1g50870 n=1 Tax=Papaver somniferum TaxID=3469 RepID=UPI000E6FD1BF|nr:putative F-box protein At1g50870 [Papaver somniferum]